MRTLAPLSAALLLATLAGCSGNVASSASSNQAETSAESIQTTTKEITESGAIALSVSYEQYSGGDVSPEALHALNAAIEKYATGLAGEAKASAFELQCKPMSKPEDVGCDYTVACKSTYLASNFVSITCAGDSFFGGAHPDFSYATVNYEIQGDTIAMSDLGRILDGAWKPALTKLIKDGVTEMTGKDDPTMAYTPEDLEIPSLLENFAVTKEGLYFADFEAPHVLGLPDTTVAWSKLEAFVPATSPIGKLVHRSSAR